MENVHISVVPHREFLPADKSGQKFFLMLKLRPTQEVAVSRPSTNFAFIIDTSGSMFEIVSGNAEKTGRTFQTDGYLYDEVTGGKSKIDIVVESLQALVRSGKLSADDRISIIQFDDKASTLVHLTPGTHVAELEKAIDRLKDFSGGTRMGLGMKEALQMLANQGMSSRQVLVFTDGQTFDEDKCVELCQEFARHNIPITALGVGDYEHELLINLSDTTGGRVLHVEPEANQGTSISINDLPNEIIADFKNAQSSQINNIALTAKTVKDIELTRVMRAYPELAEFSMIDDVYPIGNARANEETVFILEFTAERRPASRVRIAQIGLTYDVPGKNRRGELPPQNVVIQFVEGQMGAAVNQEVSNYLQQCNIAGLVKKATQLADVDPAKTQKLLETARNMTVKLGNSKMTRVLDNVQQELNATGTISLDSRKTVVVGSKGKTVAWGGNPNDDDDQFRQVSGT